MAFAPSRLLAKSIGLFAFSLVLTTQSLATVYYPGEPGEPGHADGRGGRGGRGGGTYSNVNMNGEDWAPVQPGTSARPDRNGNRVVINGVEWASPAQPGKSGAEGGMGGAGGTISVSPAKQTPRIPTTTVSTKALDGRFKMVDFACSEGTDYTLFLDSRSTIKSAEGKVDLFRVAAFCPDLKRLDVGDATSQDLTDCRKTVISEEHKACAIEFNELNKVQFNEAKARFAKPELRQGRPVLNETEIAGLDKKCGVSFGAGRAFNGTTCARTKKIALTTTAKQYSCLVDHVRHNGIRNSTADQLACYRNVVKLQTSKIVTASLGATVAK